MDTCRQKVDCALPKARNTDGLLRLPHIGAASAGGGGGGGSGSDDLDIA